MLVKKLARRRTTRQQLQGGGKTNEGLGLNRQKEHVNRPQTRAAPILESERGINSNDERLVQPGGNPGLGKERGAIIGDSHGSRFEALENLDFNVELEIGMEDEDLLCDKEDTSHTLEIPEVHGSQNEAVNLEHNSEQVMEHIVGKENIPQSILRLTREP